VTDMSIVEASSDTLNTMVLGASYPNYEDNLPPARRRIHQGLQFTCCMKDTELTALRSWEIPERKQGPI
jgi:hypothetical protein